jgi:hypothetical protein
VHFYSYHQPVRNTLAREAIEFFGVTISAVKNSCVKQARQTLT